MFHGPAGFRGEDDSGSFEDPTNIKEVSVPSVQSIINITVQTRNQANPSEILRFSNSSFSICNPLLLHQQFEFIYEAHLSPNPTPSYNLSKCAAQSPPSFPSAPSRLAPLLVPSPPVTLILSQSATPAAGAVCTSCNTRKTKAHPTPAAATPSTAST